MKAGVTDQTQKTGRVQRKSEHPCLYKRSLKKLLVCITPQLRFSLAWNQDCNCRTFAIVENFFWIETNVICRWWLNTGTSPTWKIPKYPNKGKTKEWFCAAFSRKHYTYPSVCQDHQTVTQWKADSTSTWADGCKLTGVAIYRWSNERKSSSLNCTFLFLISSYWTVFLP